MNLTHQGIAVSPKIADTTQLRCEQSRAVIEAGEYELACEAMGDLWLGVGEVPPLDSMDRAEKAEILLNIGVLTGFVGSARQVDGSQEIAKDLITRSIGIFELFSQPGKVAEARCEIALCYWRQGAFDEARLLLGEVLRTPDLDNQIKVKALLRSVVVERGAKCYNDALNILKQSASLVHATDKHWLIGAYHNELATVLENLGRLENREDYRDRTFIEYEAASFHFEQAGQTRYRARVENNLGYLFSTIGRFTDAYVHLDRARRLFLDSDDSGSVAQVDETRAQALMAEGRLPEAERFAASSVRALERGGEQAVLAEALTTYAVVIARRGRSARARALLERAVEVGETAGDREGAGRARLATIEELGAQTPTAELVSIYHSANEQLKTSQDPVSAQRLLACARIVIEVLGHRADQPTVAEGESDHTWEGFSFREEMLRAERSLIERALKDAGGVVTRAARLLGLRNHQSLIYVINFRHKDLLKSRSAVRVRRRRLMKRKKPTIITEELSLPDLESAD